MVLKRTDGKRYLLATFSLVATLFASFNAPLGATERSPFERAPVATATPPKKEAAPSRLDKVEFTGLLSFAGEVTISLYDTEEKRSFWVPLDGAQEGFSVSGFDEGTGTISVSYNGLTREIPINENEIVALKRPESRPQPSPTVKPPKPVRVKDPETMRKEEEARMFVSNLLANGMQQREKYRKEQEESRAAAGRN